MASEQLFNIKFVKEIEKRPALYNYTLNEYSRKDITEKAWIEVSKQVGMAVAECKERWKNLRAVFVRHMKPGPSGSASKYKKQYYLAEAMQFTLPYIKVLSKASGNFPEVLKQERDIDIEDVSDNEDNVIGQCSESSGSLEPSQPPPPQPLPVDGSFIEFFQAKRAKLAATEKEEDKSKNPRSEGLKMFLLSLLPDLESMTDVQVRQFKRKCLETIDDILLTPPNPSSNPVFIKTSFPSFSPSCSDH